MLLLGFLIAIFELWRAYEKIRTFWLTRYYGTTSLIFTAALALLAAITANLDLIGKTLHNPAYPDAPPRFLSGARAAGQRMTGMIDDLLNVSKFEAGELRPVLTPVYLPTLLNEKIEAFRPLAEQRARPCACRPPASCRWRRPTPGWWAGWWRTW